MAEIANLPVPRPAVGEPRPAAGGPRPAAGGPRPAAGGPRLQIDGAGDRAATRQQGFTLLEMIAAIGILVGGLTALLSLLTLAVSTRAGADARQHAVWVADRVFAELAHEPLGNPWLEEDDQKVADREPRPVEGVPGMTYSIHFVRSEQRPDVVVAEVQVAWSEQGEGQVQIFRRLLPRQNPFSERAHDRLKQAGYDPSPR